MRCWKRLADLLCGLVLLAGAALVQAADIDIRNPQLALDDDYYVLSADFAIEFNPRLEEAVSRGLAIYFVAEFELTRPRWYWFDEKAVKASQSWRLTYHALTRQYRLSTGSLHQSYGSLDEALSALSHLRRWRVAERERLNPGERLDAVLRMRLDQSQLPKPFQIEAISNKDWTLSSDWKRWFYTVPDAPKAEAARTETPAPAAGAEAK